MYISFAFCEKTKEKPPQKPQKGKNTPKNHRSKEKINQNTQKAKKRTQKQAKNKFKPPNHAQNAKKIPIYTIKTNENGGKTA